MGRHDKGTADKGSELVFRRIRNVQQIFKGVNNEQDTAMTDFERTAYRNEIDFLQHEVERYKAQNKQLMEIIFKLKGKQK